MLLRCICLGAPGEQEGVLLLTRLCSSRVLRAEQINKVGKLVDRLTGRKDTDDQYWDRREHIATDPKDVKK